MDSEECDTNNKYLPDFPLLQSSWSVHELVFVVTLKVSAAENIRALLKTMGYVLWDVLWDMFYRLSLDCLQTCNTWVNIPSCFQTCRWRELLQDLQMLSVKEHPLECILEKFPGLTEMKETSRVGVVSRG